MRNVHSILEQYIIKKLLKFKKVIRVNDRSSLLFFCNLIHEIYVCDRDIIISIKIL